MKKIFLFFIPLWLFADIDSNGDIQFWQKSHFRYFFQEEWAFMLTTEVRFGDDVSKFYYCYLEPQLLYAPADWVSLAPGYRQVAKRHPTNSSHWIPEYVPMFDLVFNANANGWRFEDRNRFEYIITEDSPYPWLYRNRFRIFFPSQVCFLNMAPFVDDEIFWRQARGINENRGSLGFRQTYSSHVSTETVYTARFLKRDSKWTYQNVFLLWLGVKW